jgi:pseudouridine-5'-phosphate glycosidase
LDTARDVALLIDTQRRLGLKSGIVIANPVPEQAALDAVEIEAEIFAALKDAEKAGVRGKAVTPFLLGRVVARSGGRSLAANKALIRSNAALAGEIAMALAALGR